MIMHRASVSAIAAILVALVMAITAVLVGTGNFLPPAAGSTGQPDKVDTEDFGLSDTSSPARTASDSRFKGAVFLDAGDRSVWFGTYVGGDAYTGTVTSTPFSLSGPEIQIPIIGYPASTGNSLALEILDAKGTVVDSIVFNSLNPKERVALWNISVKAWAGLSARLKLTDGLQGMQGWLGVGRPFGDSRWLANIPTNYARMMTAALAIAGLLFIPGAAFRTWSIRFPRNITLLPVPGLIMLAGFGLLIATGVIPGSVPGLSITLLSGCALTSAALGISWWRRGSPFEAADRSTFRIYAIVCATSLAYACLPLSVPQRDSPPWSPSVEITAPRREASLPFLTASRLLSSKDAKSLQAEVPYGSNSSESCGSVVPLCIASILAVFQVEPTLPTTHSINAWPMDSGGYFLGRIFGILTQALVIVAGACLARMLLPDAWARSLAWLAVAPVVLLNLDFPVPLLLAAFFSTLAVIAILENRSAILTGIACALAVITHPTAVILVGLVAGLLLSKAAIAHVDGARPNLGCACRRGLLFLAAFLPIVALWIHFGLRGNVMDLVVRAIAGDGHELERATDLGSWLMTRVSNVWYTLMPTALFFSPPPELAADSLLSVSLRWIDGYSGSLAGSVGYVAFLFCVMSAAEPVPEIRQLLLKWLIWGTLGLMLIVWGTSAGGLGRHGLESLSILMLVVTACASGLNDRAWRWLILATTAETLSLRSFGIFASQSLEGNAMSPQTIILSSIAIFGTIIPVIWYLRTEPAHGSSVPGSPSPPASAS